MSGWGPALLSSGVLGAVLSLVVAIMQRRQTKALAVQAEALAEKTKADRELTLAEAATKWSALLDDTRTEAFQDLHARCTDCQTRLTEVERQLGEERTAHTTTRRALRAAIRAVDSKDPAAVEEAIAAARDLT